MPIRSPKRNVSEAEHKLLLLVLLQRLEPVAAEPLWQFASGWKLLDDYIAFKLALHELVEDGEAATGALALEGLLFLTDRGREALRLFGDRVPGSARDLIAEHAEAFKAEQRRRQQVSAVYELARRGEYAVLLRVNEGEISTLRLRVRTQSQRVAQGCMERFTQTAAEALKLFYLLPTSHAEAGESYDVQPESATEYVVHADLPEADQAQIELWLLFPTRESASAFARTAYQQREALASRLIQVLIDNPTPKQE